MYKRHKVQIGFCFVGVTIVAFVLDLDFREIAETALTVASIAIGMYIAAVSVLLGSQYAKDLSQKTDPKIKSKTRLGVLAEYFRWAGRWCIFIILISCVYQIPSHLTFPTTFLKWSSAMSYGIFSVNILFFWLILIFLVNSLGKSV